MIKEKGGLDFRKGFEWYYIQSLIEKTLSPSDIEEVKKKQKEMRVHFLEVLHKTQLMPYNEQMRLIYNATKEYFDEDKYLKDININSIEIDGENRKFYLKGKEIIPVYFPKLENKDKIQVLVSYEDHKRLTEKLEAHYTGSLSEEETFSFKDIVRDAIEKKASDIHIVYKPTDKYFYTFFRIEKVLVPQPQFSMNYETGKNFIFNLKTKAADYTKGFNPELFQINQDARVEYNDIGDGVDVRLAFITHGDAKTQSLVARLLKRQVLDKEIDLSKYGYDEKTIKILKDVNKRKGGLAVISGITNSGKSTLLSALVSNVEEERRVITVEDPIEYVVNKHNVSQHQIYIPKDEGSKAGFLEYVKAIKRADPDIVVIGETRRNRELIDSLIELSQAGQLIYTTIHINRAYGIYDALYEMFGITPKTSAKLILFSMNQALVPKLCDNCKEKMEIREDTIPRDLINALPYKVKTPIEDLADDIGREIYKRGKGCEVCGGKGYKGLVPVYEYFYPTAYLMDKIAQEEPTYLQIEEECVESGIGINKLHRYVDLVKRGIIDVSDYTLQAIR